MNVIIPVKSFSGGKLRLSGAINDTSRKALGRALADHVTRTVAGHNLEPLIVSGDSEVETWATAAGYQTISDRGSGLNNAVGMAVDWVSAKNQRWLVLHSDLPLLRPDDLDLLVQVDGDVIAPSCDGGTSAISAGTPIAFAYGQASFHTHLLQLTSPKVVARTGLLHDIDTPDDLESAFRHPLGSWLSRHV